MSEPTTTAGVTSTRGPDEVWRLTGRVGPKPSTTDDTRDRLAAALRRIRDHGYQPMYNGRPSCPFCSNFVDDEQTHRPGCVLLSLADAPDEGLLDDIAQASMGGPDFTMDAPDERAAAIAAIEAEARAEGLVALRLVQEQAEDEGLWFVAQTAPEAYLQQELRRLHAAVEALAAEYDRLAGAEK